MREVFGVNSASALIDLRILVYIMLLSERLMDLFWLGIVDIRACECERSLQMVAINVLYTVPLKR